MAKLLLVDDEETILHGMEQYIKKNTTCFSRIFCATSGQEALDIIYKHHPEIMVLDIQMPGKSGIDVMKEANASGLCPQTIILSGYDTFSYAQQALRQGAVDYLLKPCRSSELAKKLADMVGEREHEGLGELASQESNHIVKSAIAYMKEHMDEDLSQLTVAENVGISPSYLSTLFAKKEGMGFSDYLNQIRITCACDYMQDERMKIYEIAYKVGYRDEKYFSKVFKKITGESPSSYRKKLGIQ